jgi:hypothetical protein
MSKGIRPGRATIAGLESEVAELRAHLMRARQVLFLKTRGDSPLSVQYFDGPSGDSYVMRLWRPMGWAADVVEVEQRRAGVLDTVTVYALDALHTESARSSSCLAMAWRLAVACLHTVSVCTKPIS